MITVYNFTRICFCNSCDITLINNQDQILYKTNSIHAIPSPFKYYELNYVKIIENNVFFIITTKVDYVRQYYTAQDILPILDENSYIKADEWHKKDYIKRIIIDTIDNSFDFCYDEN